MSTRSPENESNKISSSKSPEPSHSLLSDELSETESEDSGLSSSLASGSKRDGELRCGLRALSKVETPHYKKTESCDSVTSGHVAQEYLSGEHVIVLDAEMKGDSHSSLSHGGEMVSDEFNDFVSTDIGLKRYHSCQVLDSIPSDAGELGPKLVRRSTESNLGNVDGRLRKSLSLSLSELCLVGKGLPLCWEAREEDPVREGDVGEFTTVHYKSPEIALIPSRGFGRSVSKDSAHGAKPVWKGSDGSIGRVQPRAPEIVSTHDSNSKEAAERIHSITDSKDTLNRNDPILNSREVAEQSDSISDFKEIADQNDSISWTRLQKVEMQNAEDNRGSPTAAAENIQGSYGDGRQTNIGYAAADDADDETMKRSAEHETTRHAIVKMNHAVEDSAQSLIEVATSSAALRRRDQEQLTAFKVKAQPNPDVSPEPSEYSDTGLGTMDDSNHLLKKAPSKMNVIAESHTSLGGGRTAKEVQQIIPQPPLTRRGPIDQSGLVELDINEPVFSDLGSPSTDIDKTPRTTRADARPLPTSGGQNESIHNLVFHEKTNELKETNEQIDAIFDCKETSDHHHSIHNSKEAAERIDSITELKETSEQNDSILDSKQVAERHDFNPESKETIERNDSNPDSEEAVNQDDSIFDPKEAAEQNFSNPDSRETVKANGSIPDSKAVAEKNESFFGSKVTVEQINLILNSKEAAEQIDSIHNSKDTPVQNDYVLNSKECVDQTDSIPDSNETVERNGSSLNSKKVAAQNDSIPDLKEVAEQNDSILDSKETSEQNGSIPDFRETAEQNDSIRETKRDCQIPDFTETAEQIVSIFESTEVRQSGSILQLTNAAEQTNDSTCCSTESVVQNVSIPDSKEPNEHTDSLSHLNGLKETEKQRTEDIAAAAVHTRDASAQTSKSLEDIFVATRLGAKTAESQGSGRSCAGASPRGTLDSRTRKGSLRMEEHTDEDSSDAKLLIQTTLDFVRKALTPKSSDMITLSPLADETDSCDTVEKSEEGSRKRTSPMQSSLKGDDDGPCLSDETTQTPEASLNDNERAYACVGTKLTEWGTELLNETGEELTPRKTNFESHSDTQERNDVSQAVEQNTLSDDDNVYDEKETLSCSQSEEPAKDSSEEPDKVSSKEPAIVSSEEPATVSLEEPAKISLEEQATVSLEEPATVSSEEPAKVSSDEPDKVSSEEPATVSSEETATVSSEEPAKMSSVGPATASSEEPAKVFSVGPPTVSLEKPATVSSEEPATVSLEKPATDFSVGPPTVSSEEPANVSSEGPANVSSNSAAGIETSESNRRWRTSVNDSTTESDKIRVEGKRSEALGSDEKMFQTLDDQIEPLREVVQGYVDTIDPLNPFSSQIAGTLREIHTINNNSHEFSGDSLQDFGIVKTIETFSGNLEETVEVPHTLTRMDVPEQVKRFGDFSTTTAGVATRSEKFAEEQIQLLSAKHSAYGPENANRSSHELKILDCFSQHPNLQHSAESLEDQASSLIRDDELILGSESAHSIYEKVAQNIGQNIGLPETLNEPQQPQGKATANKESFLTDQDSDSLSSNPETSWVKHRSNFESYFPNESSTKSHTDIEQDSILAESLQDPVDSRSKILPWLTPGVTTDGRFDFLSYTNSKQSFPEYENNFPCPENSSSDFNNTTLGSEETLPNFVLHSPQFKQQTQSSQDCDDLSTSGSLHITELPAGKNCFRRRLSETTEHPERCSEADWDSGGEHLRNSRVTETEPRDSHSLEYIGPHADIRFGPSKLLELEDIDRPQSVKQKPRSFEADSNNLIHRVPNVRRVEDNRRIEKGYDLVDDVISEAGDVVEDVIIERSTGDITAKGNVVHDDATLREADYFDDVSLEGDIISKFKQTGDENFKHDATSYECVADDVTIKPCSDEIKGFTVEIRDNDDIANGRLSDFLCYGTGQMSEDIFPEPAAAAVYDDEACEHPSASWHRQPRSNDVRTAAADLEFYAGTNQDSEWPSAARLPEGTPSSLETYLDPLLEERRRIYASLLRLQYLSEEWMSLIEDHLDSGLYSTDQQLLDLVETQPSGSPLESLEEAKALHQTRHGAAGAPRLGQTTAGKPDGNAFQDEANPRRDSKEAYLGPYDYHRSYHSVSSITMPDSCQPPESYRSADAEAYDSQVMPDADRSRYTMHDRYDQSTETTARDYQSVQTMREAYQTRSLTKEGYNLPETPWERNQPQSPITDAYHLQLLSPASYHYQKMIGNTQLEARSVGKSEKYRTRFRFLTQNDPGLDPDLSFEGNSLIGTHDATKWSFGRTSKQNVQPDAAKWTHSGTGKENVLHDGAKWYLSGTGKENTTHNGGKWSRKKADTECVTHDVAKWKTGQERLPRRIESSEEFERSIPGSLYGTTKCALCTMTTIRDIAPQSRFGFERQTPVGPSSGSRRCSQCHRDYKTIFEDTMRDRTHDPRRKWMVLKPSYMPHRRSDQSLNDLTGRLTAGCVKRSMIF